MRATVAVSIRRTILVITVSAVTVITLLLAAFRVSTAPLSASESIEDIPAGTYTYTLPGIPDVPVVLHYSNFESWLKVYPPNGVTSEGWQLKHEGVLYRTFAPDPRSDEERRQIVVSRDLTADLAPESMILDRKYLHHLAAGTLPDTEYEASQSTAAEASGRVRVPEYILLSDETEYRIRDYSPDVDIDIERFLEEKLSSPLFYVAEHSDIPAFDDFDESEIVDLTDRER